MSPVSGLSHQRGLGNAAEKQRGDRRTRKPGPAGTNPPCSAPTRHPRRGRTLVQAWAFWRGSWGRINGNFQKADLLIYGGSSPACISIPCISDGTRLLKRHGDSAWRHTGITYTRLLTEVTEMNGSKTQHARSRAGLGLMLERIIGLCLRCCSASRSGDKSRLAASMSLARLLVAACIRDVVVSARIRAIRVAATWSQAQANHSEPTSSLLHRVHPPVSHYGQREWRMALTEQKDQV